jgi:hypothetical protein
MDSLSKEEGYSFIRSRSFAPPDCRTNVIGNPDHVWVGDKARTKSSEP